MLGSAPSKSRVLPKEASECYEPTMRSAAAAADALLKLPAKGNAKLAQCGGRAEVSVVAAAAVDSVGRMAAAAAFAAEVEALLAVEVEAWLQTQPRLLQTWRDAG